MILKKGQAYTISTVGLQKYVSFSKWATSAGSLASNSSNPTQLTPTQWGTLSLIAIYAPPLAGGLAPDSGRGGGGLQNVWLGYADSGCWPSCTSVSGKFTLPSSTNASVGMWIGIGGLSNPVTKAYTSLWQAGVQMNASLAGGYTIWAWWEACVGGTGPCNSTIHYNKSWTIHPNDHIFVSVTSSGGSSEFEIQDQSELNSPTWSGTDPSFSANTQYVEWVDEPNGTTGTISSISVYDLEILGVPTSMYDGYIAFENTGVPWQVTPLETGTNGYTSPQFVIED
jgi:hypothetical protein